VQNYRDLTKELPSSRLDFYCLTEEVRLPWSRKVALMEGLAEAALGTEKESSSSEEEEVPNPNDRRPDFCL
jgi:hypothetical protein